MNQRVKNLWVKALRSGKFLQGRGTLRKKVKGQTVHCCLGVLCELAVQDGVIKRFVGSNAYPSPKVLKWAGIIQKDVTVPIDLNVGDADIYGNIRLTKRTKASRMNDSQCKPFKYIADVIERNL